MACVCVCVCVYVCACVTQRERERERVSEIGRIHFFSHMHAGKLPVVMCMTVCYNVAFCNVRNCML